MCESVLLREAALLDAVEAWPHRNHETSEVDLRWADATYDFVGMSNNTQGWP